MTHTDLLITSIVEQTTADCDTAQALVDELERLAQNGAVDEYGLNTRTGELEIKQPLSIGDSVTGPTAQLGELTTELEELGLSIRLITWETETLMERLAENLGFELRTRDIDNVWCETAQLYCHALYYLTGEFPPTATEYQNQCPVNDD